MLTTTAQANIDSLLDALTLDNWFEMLPILADAYRDADRWDDAEAVEWLWRKGRKPTLDAMWPAWTWDDDTSICLDDHPNCVYSQHAGNVRHYASDVKDALVTYLLSPKEVRLR